MVYVPKMVQPIAKCLDYSRRCYGLFWWQQLPSVCFDNHDASNVGHCVCGFRISRVALLSKSRGRWRSCRPYIPVMPTARSKNGHHIALVDEKHTFVSPHGAVNA